jgi:hypothetical protein
MKKLFTLLALAVLGISIQAAEPRYVPVPLTLPGTVAAATTTNVATFIDVRKQQSLTLSIYFKMTAACDSNMTYVLERSLDGSTVGTTAESKITLSPTANGTTAVCLVTNIDIGGTGWLRLASIANPHASAVLTNQVVLYSVKMASP